MSDRTVSPFWNRVRKLMRAHKISQEKFAAHIDLNFHTLKSWIRFNRLPDVYTAFDMALALGVSLEQLITGKDSKAQKQQEKQAKIRKTAAANIKKMAIKINENAALIR